MRRWLNVTPLEKSHWRLVLFYVGLLALSALAFVAYPNPMMSPNWNGLFQIFGPTIGTLLLSGFTLMRVVGGRVSIVNGVAAILLLVAISFGCLALTMPIMMGI
jgi:hypothetical protein